MKHLFKAWTLAVAALLLVLQPAKSQTALSLSRTAEAENKVAVLPLTYIGDGNEVKMEEMQYVLQNIAYRFLKDKALELKFQSPVETNALLLKNGVTRDNFRKFTPKELAAILQVEYVVTGIVSESATALVTNQTANRRFDKDYFKRVDELQSSVRTRTSQDLNTTIDISIHNDKGEEIFSRSRRSILSDADMYKNTLHYVLKRCPLYKR